MQAGIKVYGRKESKVLLRRTVAMKFLENMRKRRKLFKALKNIEFPKIDLYDVLLGPIIIAAEPRLLFFSSIGRRNFFLYRRASFNT